MFEISNHYIQSAAISILSQNSRKAQEIFDILVQKNVVQTTDDMMEMLKEITLASPTAIIPFILQDSELSKQLVDKTNLYNENASKYLVSHGLRSFDRQSSEIISMFTLCEYEKFDKEIQSSQKSEPKAKKDDGISETMNLGQRIRAEIKKYDVNPHEKTDFSSIDHKFEKADKKFINLANLFIPSAAIAVLKENFPLKISANIQYFKDI